MEPRMTAIRLVLKDLGEKSTSPMMTEASPITMVPTPMPTSAKPFACATVAPDKATRALEITSPSTTIVLVLMPCARAICGLKPVARMAVPSSVPKNQYRMTAISAAKIRPTARPDTATDSPSEFSRIVKTVSSCKRPMLDLPMTWRLTE